MLLVQHTAMWTDETAKDYGKMFFYIVAFVLHNAISASDYSFLVSSFPISMFYIASRPSGCLTPPPPPFHILPASVISTTKLKSLVPVLPGDASISISIKEAYALVRTTAT